MRSLSKLYGIIFGGLVNVCGLLIFLVERMKAGNLKEAYQNGAGFLFFITGLIVIVISFLFINLEND